jgi:hypothetical protein
VELFNRGDIAAEYTLTSGAGPFCEYFSFSPSAGTLKRGDVHPIDITFCCDKLGEFDETFICQIEGSAEVRPTEKTLLLPRELIISKWRYLASWWYPTATSIVSPNAPSYMCGA